MSLFALLDRLRVCRRDLLRERGEMLVLHDEHRELSERVVRQAAKTKDALVRVTIIMTVEEIDRLFCEKPDADPGGPEPDRGPPSRRAV